LYPQLSLHLVLLFLLRLSLGLLSTVILLFLFGVILLRGRSGQLSFQSSTLLFLIIEDALEFEYLVLEFPQRQFGVVAA
jgi:hypothetical protein